MYSIVYTVLYLQPRPIMQNSNVPLNAFLLTKTHTILTTTDANRSRWQFFVLKTSEISGKERTCSTN